MTHGTDRDTPSEDVAARDVADVPDRSAAEAGEDEATQVSEVDAPTDEVSGDEVSADEVSADDASADDRGPDDTSTAEEPETTGPADEPRSAEPDAAAPADEPDAAEPDVAGPADEPGAPAANGSAPRVTGAPRPLAPAASEPLAAWPSWEDVAVTAPAAGVGVPDGAGTTPVGAPEAEPTPEVEPETAGGVAEPDPAPAHDDRTPDEDTVAPPPRQDLGGLSALAFTALNAASVGVAAHALPRSPLPAGDAGQGGTAAPGVPETATVRLSAGGPAAPAADEPAADESAATDEPAADESAGTDEPADDESAATDEPAATEDSPAAPADDAPDAAASAVPPASTAASAAGSTAAAPAAAPAAASADARDVAVTRAVPVASWPSTDQGPGEAPSVGGPVAATPGADRDASPLDVFEPEDGRRRWPRVLAIVGGVVGLLAVLYVGGSYALADRVPRGATVAGVQIGGMSSGEAEQVLTEELAQRTTETVPVVAQEVQSEVDPVAAGLVLDAEATVARLTGVDLTEPVRLWRHLVGVGAQQPVTQVDESALDATLTQLSGSLVLAPVDGTVVFADGAAHATEAVDGWELDTAAAATTLTDGWLTDERPIDLPTAVVAPAVTQEETQRALTELAQPLAAAPVTVRVADRQAVLDVPTLTAHAALVPVDGALELQVDGQALTDAVLAQVPDLLTEAADARFEFQDGAPVIVPGTPGTTLDPAAVGPAVVQAATAGTDRVAAVELVQSDPAQTTEALQALGVKEIVSERSTPLTSEPRRTANIAAGLANITGTLVRPGETFSLTEALGPVDAAHGFVQAGAIVNGAHTDAWGGGLSQVSTTVFNAAYFAGYEDVEHTPHSEWFSRYPEGREATIFTGVIDLKWKNNTPYGALVQGFVADGRAVVRIWSTKHFTVESDTSGRSGVVAPTTVYSQSPTCEPQSKGNPGFTVTNTRRVYLNGELVDTESDTWRYKPQNQVVCGTAPTPGAAPTP